MKPTWHTDEAYRLISNHEIAYALALQDRSKDNLEKILLDLITEYDLDTEHLMFHLIDFDEVSEKLSWEK